MTVRIPVLANSYTSITAKHKKSQNVISIVVTKQRTSLVVAAAAKVARLFHIQEVQGTNLKNVLPTEPR